MDCRSELLTLTLRIEYLLRNTTRVNVLEDTINVLNIKPKTKLGVNIGYSSAALLTNVAGKNDIRISITN